MCAGGGVRVVRHNRMGVWLEHQVDARSVRFAVVPLEPPPEEAPDQVAALVSRTAGSTRKQKIRKEQSW